MSELTTKIISVIPYSKAVFNHAAEIESYIKNITDAQTEAFESNSINFVDCGSELEEIICPCCKNKVDMDWWNETVNDLYDTGFSDLNVEMYCCGRRISVNDLEYRLPCGFASAEFRIKGDIPLSDDEIKVLGYIINEDVRVIKVYE